MPDVDTSAATLRAALEAAFAFNPRLRGYVLDDQGHLRANVVVFIEAGAAATAWRWPTRCGRDSRVHVLQALSGG